MPIYVAYSHISSYEGPNGETLLDADTDLDELRRRVNAYMALPKQVDYYRGKQEIPDGAMESRHYNNCGGGCYYSNWLSIKEVKPLIVPRET